MSHRLGYNMFVNLLKGMDMANKPRPMSVRFLRQEDIDAIQRVERAAQNGAVTDVSNPELNRFMTLRSKARAIDISVSPVTVDHH